MRVMCRFYDGWNVFDNVVEVERDPEFGADPYEMLYEVARYLPKDCLLQYDDVYNEAMSAGADVDYDDPFSMQDYLEDKHGGEPVVVFADYLNAFVMLYFVDQRPVPPNSKLGPVEREMPQKEHYRR